MESCVFCRIIKGEIPAAKVYEDEEITAFLDIAPASERGGPTLVMPKRHMETITDLSEEELNAVMRVVRKIVKALLKFGEGVNVLQNNKRVAGQAVAHMHIHVIPRFERDGIVVEKWVAHRYKEGEIEKVAERIRSFLKD